MATPSHAFATLSKQGKLIHQYRACMMEAKARLACLDFAVAGHTGLPPGAVRDFCFLQLRMLCELTALSCLVAHGDVPNLGAPRKEWAAGKIMTPLEKLHPEFYPTPCTVKQASANSFAVTPLTSGFLTKKDLLKLAGICGNFLHRGKMDDDFFVVSDKPPQQPSLEEELVNVIKPARQMYTLLALHSILLITGDRIMCELSYAALNGQVAVALAGKNSS